MKHIVPDCFFRFCFTVTMFAIGVLKISYFAKLCYGHIFILRAQLNVSTND